MQWITNETETGKRLKLAVGTVIKTWSFNKQNGQNYTTQQTEATQNIAGLQEPMLNRLLNISKDFNAKLIVSWTDMPGSSSDSYQWLQRWAMQHDVAFADWHPGVESVQRAIPQLPIHNPHSGGHYRTWVNWMIAKAFAKQIKDQ